LGQPYLENPEKGLQLKIEEFAKLRKSKVLLFHTYKEEINRANYEEINDFLKCSEQFEQLDVVIESFGGDIHAAFKIADLLKKMAKKLNVLVPRHAKSAATLICLAADEVGMCIHSELGPLDAQVPHPRDPHRTVSALDGFKALEFCRNYAIETMDLTVKFLLERGLKVDEAIERALRVLDITCTPLFSQIDPWIIGEYDRTLEIAKDYGILLLKNKISSDKIKDLLDKMIRGYPSHGFIINMEEAKELGIKIFTLNQDEIKICSDISDILNDIEDTIILFSEKKEKGDE